MFEYVENICGIIGSIKLFIIDVALIMRNKTQIGSKNQKQFFHLDYQRIGPKGNNTKLIQCYL